MRVDKTRINPLAFVARNKVGEIQVRKRCEEFHGPVVTFVVAPVVVQCMASCFIGFDEDRESHKEPLHAGIAWAIP